ncbi:MAG: hypothetical protein M0R22_07640 [Dehalococcoidia bacterium]|jgi:hypothetical protein|nr:hypothetical protein [Dehalococcoidia bacterium]
MRLVAYDGTGAILWPRWIALRIGKCVSTAADAMDVIAREDREWAAGEGRLPVTPAEIGFAEAMETGGDND